MGIMLFLCCHCSPIKTSKDINPVILDRASVQWTQKKELNGTGRVLFKDPLFDLRSKELYYIKAELFNEDSSLTLHSHFTGFDTEDGIKINFKREEHSLKIFVSTPSYPPKLLHTVTKHFAHNQTLEIYIEVKNKIQNSIGIKIWQAYINSTSYIKTPVSSLSRRNLIINSEDHLFYSTGKGLLWGVDLNKARILKIFRESVNQ